MFVFLFLIITVNLNGLCVDDGSGNGKCNTGPDERACDGVVKANGTGILSCGTNADCPAGQQCTLDYLCVQPPSGCQWDGMCTDSDGCTIDECDLKTHACTHTKAFGCCATDKDCDDGNACTIDACKNGQCGHDGKPACCTVAADCNDGSPCRPTAARAAPASSARWRAAASPMAHATTATT